MRRPLAPHANPAVFKSPFERIVAAAGFASEAMPAYIVAAPLSPYFFADVPALAGRLGLCAVPNGYVDKYPLAPLGAEDGPKQHKTEFLQWGWATRPNKQILFEMADSAFGVSLHFMKQEPGKNNYPWHLDSIEIDVGTPEFYHVPCDEAEYEPLVRAVLDTVGAATASLNRDDWQAAGSVYHRGLRPVIQALDDIAIRMEQQHAAEWQATAMRDRAQGRPHPKSL